MTTTTHSRPTAPAEAGDCGRSSPAQGSPADWRADAPINDGDYYYTGPTPSGKPVVAIVGIVTIDGKRHAYLYVPPKWRGDEEERGTLHHGLVAEWTGQWAGPEDGLCCVTANSTTSQPAPSTS